MTLLPRLLVAVLILMVTSILGCTANLNYFTVDQDAEGTAKSGSVPANSFTIHADGATLKTSKSQDARNDMPVKVDADISEAVETVAKKPQDSSENQGESEESGGETEEEEPSPVTSTRFDHWNPKSWDGKGSSIVLCLGDTVDGCAVNGKTLTYHGLDYDRQVWTARKTPGLGGEVICKKGDISYQFSVSNTKMDYGNCEGKPL